MPRTAVRTLTAALLAAGPLAAQLAAGPLAAQPKPPLPPLPAVVPAAAPTPASLPPAGPDAKSPAAPVVVATVNGASVTLDRVDAFLKRRNPGPVPPAQLRRMRELIASDMVDDLLLRQFLRKHAPAVTPAEIDKHMKSLADSQTRQGKTLSDFFRDSGQTETEVRETWADMLQLAAYVKAHVTDDQLKQYHAANRDHFDRVEVRVSHVVIRANAAAPPAERAAAREKLTALRAEIASGAVEFADAAKKHSECPTAPKGGDLGFIVRKGMLVDEAFCKAAFALKPGELSEVVETPFGAHLIRVTDRKPGTPSAFEKCVEEVREQFTDEFHAELVAKLRKQAEVAITVP